MEIKLPELKFLLFKEILIPLLQRHRRGPVCVCVQHFGVSCRQCVFYKAWEQQMEGLSQIVHTFSPVQIAQMMPQPIQSPLSDWIGWGTTWNVLYWLCQPIWCPQLIVTLSVTNHKGALHWSYHPQVLTIKMSSTSCVTLRFKFYIPKYPDLILLAPNNN